MSLALTGFSLVRGKRDFARLYHTKGRKELSVTQMILVTNGFYEPPSGFQRDRDSAADLTFRRFVSKLKRNVGSAKLFGRFGIAYDADKPAQAIIERFESTIPFKNRDKRIFRTKRITTVARREALSKYVLVLLQN